VKYQLEQQVAG